MANLEKDARAIYFEALKAVDLPTRIRQRVKVEGDRLLIDDQSYDLTQFSEVILIGIGKASLHMGAVVESILGPHLSTGLLVTNRRQPVSVKSEIIVAGHPVPNENSLRAGKRAVENLANCQPDSLILFLISGGGSSLFELPISGEITLEDLRELNRILVECGASIEEINVVRKQFSAVKGGKLSEQINARTAIALLVSDVNAGDFKTLASNPLLPEENSLQQFRAIVEKYKLTDKWPAVFQRFQNDVSQPDPEELEKKNRPNVDVFLLAENADVMNEAAHVAHQLGYITWLDQADSEGTIEQNAARLISVIAELKSNHPDRHVCVISGGEVSCPVRGPGFGGRNQEFALYSAMKLKKSLSHEALVLSCGTDGIDGKSVAVGAMAHSGQLENGNLDDLQRYFQSSDTASWFSEFGGMFVTGPTGNNIRDLRIILAD